MSHSIAQPDKAQQHEDARRLGRLDAKDGQPCLPELYFTRPSQWVAYVRGYEAQMGVQTPLSRQAWRIAAARLAGGK